MEWLAGEAAGHEAPWLLLLLLLLLLLHLREHVLVHGRLLRRCVRLMRLLLLVRRRRLHLLLLLLHLLLLEEGRQLGGAGPRALGRADCMAAGRAAEGCPRRRLPSRHQVLVVAVRIAALRVARGQ